MTTTTTTYLMTGDIGGTNSRMSLYEAHASCDGKNAPLYEKTYRNFDALPEHVRSDPHAFCKYIIIPFLEYCWQDPKERVENEDKDDQPTKKKNKVVRLVPLHECTIFCCLATAGIVHDNQVEMTNLGNLKINGHDIPGYQYRDRSSIGATNPYVSRIVQCHIVNDFVAQGYGCLTLAPEDVVHLHGPKIAAPRDLIQGPKVCVGAGTGLGECYLTQSMGDAEGMYTCFPSEGGHVEYAPRNEVEVALFQYLNEKFSTKHRISVERVVSGIGLANVYEFLAQYYPNRVDVTFQKAFEQAEPDEKPALVSKRAHEDYDKEEKQKEQPVSLCRLAMNIMMSAYGCEVGSSAIKWIPTGGLFVTGGLTPKNMKFIASNGDGMQTEFMKSYLHKGRVSTLLPRIPLYAVLVEDLGVRGAHKAAQMAFEQYQREHNNGIMTAPTNNKNSSTTGCGAVKSCIQEWPWCVSFMVTAALGFAVGAIFSKKNKGL